MKPIIHYSKLPLKILSGLLFISLYSCNYTITDQDNASATDTAEHLLIIKDVYRASGVKQCVATSSDKNNSDTGVIEVFDKNGNIIKSINDTWDRTVLYKYKNDTLVSETVVRKDTSATIYTFFDYENKLLKTERTVFPSNEIDTIVYTYNNLGLLLQKQIGKTVGTYKYNDEQLLIEERDTITDDPFFSTQSYVYNNKGWMIKKTLSVHSNMFSKPLKTTHYYTYNHKGLLIKEKKEYNLNQQSTNEFEYNTQNLLIKKTHCKSMFMDSTVTTYHYTYWE